MMPLGYLLRSSWYRLVLSTTGLTLGLSAGSIPNLPVGLSNEKQYAPD